MTETTSPNMTHSIISIAILVMCPAVAVAQNIFTPTEKITQYELDAAYCHGVADGSLDDARVRFRSGETNKAEIWRAAELKLLFEKYLITKDICDLGEGASSLCTAALRNADREGYADQGQGRLLSPLGVVAKKRIQRCELMSEELAKFLMAPR